MLVFLLEEASMKFFLDAFVPRVLPGVPFKTIPHSGKNDLEKSLPRKLRAGWPPDTRFVVVRDQDQADCRAIKRRLADLCAAAGRPDALVRIACRELEAWFLGDLPALAEISGRPTLAALGEKARYRDPDAVDYPSRAIAELVPDYKKTLHARRMAAALDPDRCRSESLRQLVAGLRRIARTTGG